MITALNRLLLAILIAIAPLSASADEAALEGAVARYLAGDDETALPALSVLARRGDVDAQILLGSIAKRPPGAWLRSLDRPERRALMRAPGGSFGASWIKVAAEAGDERAKALLAAEAPRWSPETARALLDAGETDQLAISALRAGDYGIHPGVREFLKEPALSDEIARLFWISLATFDAISREDAQTIAALTRRLHSPAPLIIAPILHRQGRDAEAAFPAGLPATLLGGFSVIQDDVAPAPIAEFLENEPDRAMRRALAFCDVTCTDDRPRCLRDVVALSGGYRRLWELGSPAPSVIPEDDFLRSPRLAVDFRAHVESLSGGWGDGLKASIRGRSCVARALIAP